MMQPRIETLKEKKLAGKRLRMSFTRNQTFQLWRSFMPERKKIRNMAGPDLYSVEVYDNPLFFSNFSPAAEFEKWAAAEVTSFDDIPEGMEPLTLPQGLYAVFTHVGPASEGHKTYEQIFGSWLPASGYVVDDRPHFALMGDKYLHEDPASEEEIWIPVKPNTRAAKRLNLNNRG
jgi:AraC family transcriptional regulator